MMLIGLPSTLPPKSSIAICADVTEPWPVGVDAGPFMSVRTPILTTSSESCASAAVDASSATARIPSLDSFPANIVFPPWSRRVGRSSGQAVAPPIGLNCNYLAPPSTWPKVGGWAVSGSVYFRLDSGHSRAMISPQRLPNSLTPLDHALDALLQGVEPVAPVELPLAEALR